MNERAHPRPQRALLRWPSPSGPRSAAPFGDRGPRHPCCASRAPAGRLAPSAGGPAAGRRPC
eukprot:15064929-Alexandrium_andersonii.AAC.1